MALKRAVGLSVTPGGSEPIYQQIFDQIVERTLARRREKEQGVMSLFGDLGADDGEAGFDDARWTCLCLCDGHRIAARFFHRRPARCLA